MKFPVLTCKVFFQPGRSVRRVMNDIHDHDSTSLLPTLTGLVKVKEQYIYPIQKTFKV